VNLKMGNPELAVRMKKRQRHQAGGWKRDRQESKKKTGVPKRLKNDKPVNDIKRISRSSGTRKTRFVPEYGLKVQQSWGGFRMVRGTRKKQKQQALQNTRVKTPEA